MLGTQKRRPLLARRTSERIHRALRPLFLSKEGTTEYEAPPTVVHGLPSHVPRAQHKSFHSGISMHQSARGEDRLINHTVRSQSNVVHIFGVVDGHGGPQCATFVSEELPRVIEGRARELQCEKESLLSEVWGNVLEYTFDQVASQWDALGTRSSGAVASLVLVCKRSCLIAHAGDCKIIASLSNDSYVELTRDHRCSDPDEAERVETAGGVVVNGRVEGKLLPSRAFGDIDVRTIADGKVLNCIAPEPEICYYSFEEAAEAFMVIASDGLFDTLSAQRVVSLVRDYLGNGGTASGAATMLTEMASKRTKDDVSVIVLDFGRQ